LNCFAPHEEKTSTISKRDKNFIAWINIFMA
jgi:hypothetical protein